jgi:hypothetical protein
MLKNTGLQRSFEKGVPKQEVGNERRGSGVLSEALARQGP